MIWGQKYFTFVVLAAASTLATAQYDTYENSSEEDEYEEDRPQFDYTRYFGGLGGNIISPPAPAQSAQESAGFVQPFDFTGIFGSGHFGLDGITGGTSQQIFQAPVGVGVVLPDQKRGFIVHEEGPTNNSGFVNNNVNFRSLFDASVSASEHGFRPEDYINKDQLNLPSHKSLFSPGFASLQRDIDREVHHQRKEEAAVEQSRLANRRQPVEYDSEEDSEDFNSSEDENDDPPILEPDDRLPQKYFNDNEEGKKYEVPTSGKLQYKPPQRVGEYVNPSLTFQPGNSKYTKPLPSIPERDESYHPYSDHDKRGQTDSKLLQKPIHSFKQPSQYEYPGVLPKQQLYRNQPYNNKPKHPSEFRNSPYNTNPKHFAISSQTINGHPRQSPVEFRPSPRDPYQDNFQGNINSRKPINLESRSRLGNKGLYTQPQSEIASIVQPRKKLPGKSPTERTKFCRKIQKKMDSKDFSRFKRQQMTCYICKDKDGGNTYEECSYESQPQPKSIYKGTKEMYSSDVPNVYHTRERRSVNKATNITWKNVTKDDTPFIRKVRQYYNVPLTSEMGHGSEHYRFGPEYFQNDENNSKEPKRANLDYDDGKEYDDDESEEESDIEKEYEPPGASDQDDCQKVNKDGLICMVCKNYKTGGSYEQCSYASDPDENRYAYARQSSYGSKRVPRDYRIKNYSNKPGHINEKRTSGKILGRDPNRNVEEDKENPGFKHGKLKKKKVLRKIYNKQGKEKPDIKPKTIQSEAYDTATVGLDPFFYGSPGKQYDPDDYDERGIKIKRKSNDKTADDKSTSVEDYTDDFDPTYEESFYRLFPELQGVDPYSGESTDKILEAQKRRVNEEHNGIPYKVLQDDEESESNRDTHKVLPEFDGEALNYNYDYEPKKDLEKMLQEFSTKNRTDCKRILKNKMTCYQCLDNKGIQHEECMLVAASDPKGKHLAYHEVKEYKVIPKLNENYDEKSVTTEIAPLLKVSSKTRTTILKPLTGNIPKSNVHAGKVNNPNGPKRELTNDELIKIRGGEAITTELPLFSLKDSEKSPGDYDILKLNPENTYVSPEFEKDIPIKTNNDVLMRKKRKHSDVIHKQSEPRKRTTPEQHDDEDDDSVKKEKHPNERPNYNPVLPDSVEFDEREGPEGAYTHETEPVFDSVLKITLPKYMLTRSEHEEIFDEVLRSG